MRNPHWPMLGSVLAMTTLFSCAPASSPSTKSPPTLPSKGLVVTQIKTSNVSAHLTRVAEEPRKAWLSATDWDNMTANDVYWLDDSRGFPGNDATHTLIAQYDAGETWSKALPLLSPPSQMIGGGFLFHVQEQESGNQAPVQYVDGNAQFTLTTGVAYYAYVEFFLDGANETEMDGEALMLPFVATGQDTLSFSVTDTDAIIYVNGEQAGGTTLWFGENAEVAQELGTSHNEVAENSEGRSAWRKRNYELYGGDGKVAEFLMQ